MLLSSAWLTPPPSPKKHNKKSQKIDSVEQVKVILTPESLENAFFDPNLRVFTPDQAIRASLPSDAVNKGRVCYQPGHPSSI